MYGAIVAVPTLHQAEVRGCVSLDAPAGSYEALTQDVRHQRPP